jgi:probable F420-dependent oxidoreductase
MRLGLMLPQIGAVAARDDAAEVITAVARGAEDAGVGSLWVQEHFLYLDEPTSGYAGIPGRPMPDAWRDVLDPLDTLSYVAAVTRTAVLGTSILVTGYHRPVQLAKRVATVDVLSGGRMSLGLGVGWSADEHAQCDTPMAGRGARADELCAALRACWGDDPVSFDGAVFTIPPGRTSPKPVGAIPLVAGFWSPAGLERCARWCDWWQPAGRTADQAAATMAKINEMATGLYGRPPLKLSLRVFVTPGMPVDTTQAMLDDAAANGCDEVVLDTTFLGLDADGWRAVPDWVGHLSA